MRALKDLTIVLALACASFAFVAAGLRLLPQSDPANDLLDAGFRIFDPEGYEVERFDGASYLTTEPQAQDVSDRVA